MTLRRIIRVSGADARPFLQGLVTSDVDRLSDGPLYTALLTPQGKLIADFFLMADGDSVLLDVADALADDLSHRLSMYKLRADVTIAPTELHLHRGLGPIPEDGFADPRHPDLGWRAFRSTPQAPDDTDWDSLRVRHLIPETGIELTPDTFILEAGFERLNGVDFRKGCYVGQEVTARMKHKTELRKGLARVQVDGTAAPGTEITSNGKAAGVLFTQSGGEGIAYLRHDRVTDAMTAGSARVAPGKP